MTFSHLAISSLSGHRLAAPYLPVPMPNDGALTDHLADWLPDAAIRHRVLVDRSCPALRILAT
jgi:hypothetical protein